MAAAAAAQPWALLVPHHAHPEGAEPVPLIERNVSIGSGPQHPIPTSTSKWQHVQVAHDPFASRLHVELKHSDGSVFAIGRSRSNDTFLNGLPLVPGKRVKVERDPDNRRFQLSGEDADAPMLFLVVPNRQAAEKWLPDHTDSFTGFTLRMNPLPQPPQPQPPQPQPPRPPQPQPPQPVHGPARTLPGGIFAGLRILLPKMGSLKFGYDATVNGIVRCGGVVLSSGSVDDVSSATHLVLDASETPEDVLPNLAQLSIAAWPRVHVPQWVWSCQKCKKLLPGTYIHPKCPRDKVDHTVSTETTPSDGLPSRSSLPQDNRGAGRGRDTGASAGASADDSSASSRRLQKRLLLCNDGPRTTVDASGHNDCTPAMDSTYDHGRIVESFGVGGSFSSRPAINAWQPAGGHGTAESDGEWSDDEDSVALGPEVAEGMGLTCCQLMVTIFKRLAAIYRFGGAGARDVSWAKNQHCERAEKRQPSPTPSCPRKACNSPSHLPTRHLPILLSVLCVTLLQMHRWYLK